MNGSILIVVLTTCLSCPSTALAVIGASDVAPAATLLYPYFEVDPSNPYGVTTLLTVANSSATASVVHFTLWTDLGVPTETFNVYLTGYDVQAINLRDILVQGLAPRTASDGQDPTDQISPQGPVSQDINFASCSGSLDPDELDPYGADGPAPGYGLPPEVPWLGAERVAELQRAHSGQPLVSAAWAAAGRCVSTSRGDGILRGYVTADTVNSCTSRTPVSPGYYTDVSFQNVLFGDFLIVDLAQNFAEGEAAVHVEAYPWDFAGLTASTPTFYGAYGGDAWRTAREALPTRFVVPWGNGSDLVTWRSAEQPLPADGWACGGALSPYPLDVAGVSVFDTEENALGFSPGLSFSVAAQSDAVNEAGFPGAGTGKGGLLFVDLRTTTASGAFGTRHQGWLLHRTRPEPPGGQGRFLSMTRAIVLDGADANVLGPSAASPSNGGAR
ncbi:MAG: hypothetical protein ACYDBY_07180 [Thermoanaerobaculia bacterium]